jgi:hypothetical protein
MFWTFKVFFNFIKNGYNLFLEEKKKLLQDSCV